MSRFSLALLALALSPAVARARPPTPRSSPCAGSTARPNSARSRSVRPGGWRGGAAYTTLERSRETEGGQDIVRYDVETGARDVLVAAARLVPPATRCRSRRGLLLVEDERQLLVFTNSQPVWRQNTRGRLLGARSRTPGGCGKLGGSAAKPSTLMFAKFSPDGRRVGYVRENQSVRRRPRDRANHPAHQRRLPHHHQRHLRLGLRGGAGRPGRLALEPRRQAPSRSGSWCRQRAGLQPDRQHRLALLAGRPDPVSQGRRVELRGPGRYRAAPTAGGSAGFRSRATRATTTSPGWSGPASSDEVGHRAAQPAAEHQHGLPRRPDAPGRCGRFSSSATAPGSTWWTTDHLARGRARASSGRASGTAGRTSTRSRATARRQRLLTPGAFDVLGVAAVDDGGRAGSTTSPRRTIRPSATSTGCGSTATGRRSGSPRPDQAGTHAYNVAPNGSVAFHTYSQFRRAAHRPTWSGCPTHQVVRTLVANTRSRHEVAALTQGPAGVLPGGRRETG